MERTIERNALGDELPRSWAATVAVIWCGQAASVFATCAASFAAMWFITESTASPLWLSLASAAALLPVALLSPFGGVAADRFSRKHVMIAADGTAGALSLVFALALFAEQTSVPLMLLILAVRASAQAFHGPALSALMPSLVPERHLVRINSMDQAVTSLSSIAGPALGILLYNLVGLGGVMVLDAACAAFACLCLGVAHVPPRAAGATAPSTVLGDLREGAIVIMRDAGLRNLMLLVTATMLIAVELFVLPGFGVAGIGGIVLVTGGLIMASSDFPKSFLTTAAIPSKSDRSIKFSFCRIRRVTACSSKTLSSEI